MNTEHFSLSLYATSYVFLICMLKTHLTKVTVNSINYPVFESAFCSRQQHFMTLEAVDTCICKTLFFHCQTAFGGTYIHVPLAKGKHWSFQSKASSRKLLEGIACIHVRKKQTTLCLSATILKLEARSGASPTSKGLMSRHPNICQSNRSSNVFTWNPENRNWAVSGYPEANFQWFSLLSLFSAHPAARLPSHHIVRPLPWGTNPCSKESMFSWWAYSSN